MADAIIVRTTDVVAFENAIMQAIAQAKECGLAQGLVVALLHAHAQAQTQAMLDNA